MNDIQTRASDKAFAKIHAIHNSLRNLKSDLKQQRYGPITKEEILLCIKCEEIDLDVWNYIYKLIETDNKL